MAAAAAAAADEGADEDEGTHAGPPGAPAAAGVGVSEGVGGEEESEGLEDPPPPRYSSRPAPSCNTKGSWNKAKKEAEGIKNE